MFIEISNKYIEMPWIIPGQIFIKQINSLKQQFEIKNE